MTWKQLIERDSREWKLSAFEAHERDTWRFDMRSAMCTASLLLGRRPTDADVAPILQVNQKFVDDDDDMPTTAVVFLYESVPIHQSLKQTVPVFISVAVPVNQFVIVSFSFFIFLQCQIRTVDLLI